MPDLVPESRPSAASKPAAGPHNPAAGAGAPFRPPQREAFRPTPPGRVPPSPSTAGPRERARAVSGESKKLLVGRDIELSGVISACESLVVEGRVETDLTNAVLIEVSATGTFSGKATVDHADIAGVFDGDLTVRKKLTIARSGRVTGTIRYATLEVEAGGRLSGTVEPLDDEAAGHHPRSLSFPTASGPAGHT
jgi:cytoskeletal protein CcmA (bactofilin family)